MYEQVGSFALDLWEAFDLDAIAMNWFPHEWGAAPAQALSPFRSVVQSLVADVGSLSLIAIKPNGMILPHEDGMTAGWVRYHFVLRTNRWCWSFHDGTWQQLRLGGLYRMDPNTIHASVNWGETTRWHLIADTHPVD